MTLVQTEPKSIKIGTTNIKRVTIRPNGTEKQIRPAGWQPGANTVAYFPFDADQLDHVGSSTISITGTSQTLGYNFSSSSEITVQTPPTTCRFVSAWVKYNSYNGSISQFGGTYIGYMIYNFRHQQQAYNKTFQISTGYGSYNVSSSQNTTTGQRYHIAMGYDGTNAYGYINGQKVWDAPTGSYSSGSIRFGYGINMDVSEYILESQVWSAQEVLDYYNQTKGNYGL